MDLFKDKHLLTKEYFEKKSESPVGENTTPPPLIKPSSPSKKETPEVVPPPPGRWLGQEALDGKVVGLLFSAGWSPPCQQFVALLGDTYSQLKERNANFEVVFLSFDKTAENMETYFTTKHKDWYCLPFDDNFKDELKEKYNVTAVPKFIIINKDGEIITSKGRKEIQDKGLIAFRNWQQSALTHESKLAQALHNAEINAQTEEEKTTTVPKRQTHRGETL